MKKLTFPLCVLLIAFTACAQSSHLDKFYQQYHSTDNGDGIDPTFLFSASFSLNNGDSKDDKDGNWMHKITSVRCLIIDGKKTPDAVREWSDLSASLRADHFEEWFSIRKGQGRVQLLSHDKNDVMEEIACLIVGDDGSGLFFHLRGHFTAADRARMEAALQSHDNE
jgi:Domain of unknown function (DUF4252)